METPASTPVKRNVREVSWPNQRRALRSGSSNQTGDFYSLIFSLQYLSSVVRWAFNPDKVIIHQRALITIVAMFSQGCGCVCVCVCVCGGVCGGVGGGVGVGVGGVGCVRGRYRRGRVFTRIVYTVRT